MSEEGYIRKVKYGIVVGLFIVAILYIDNVVSTTYDATARSFYEFIFEIIFVLLGYFALRFLIILFMDNHRFLRAIDTLLSRAVNAIYKTLVKIASSNHSSSNYSRYQENYQNRDIDDNDDDIDDFDIDDYDDDDYNDDDYDYSEPRYTNSPRYTNNPRYTNSPRYANNPGYTNSLKNTRSISSPRKSTNIIKDAERDFHKINRGVERDLRRIDKDIGSILGNGKKKRKRK